MRREEFLRIAINRDLFRKEQTESFINGTDPDNKKLFEAMDKIDLEYWTLDGRLPEKIEKTIVNGKGAAMLMKACKVNLPFLVRALLKFQELFGPKTMNTAAITCIMSNSIECFNELIKSGKVDWNKVDERTGQSSVGVATHYHRVEMVKAQQFRHVELEFDHQHQ